MTFQCCILPSTKLQFLMVLLDKLIVIKSVMFILTKYVTYVQILCKGIVNGSFDYHESTMRQVQTNLFSQSMCIYISDLPHAVLMFGDFVLTCIICTYTVHLTFIRCQQIRSIQYIRSINLFFQQTAVTRWVNCLSFICFIHYNVNFILI